MKKHVKSILIQLGYPDIIVDNLYHPVGFVEPLFNPDTIDKMDTIVSLGAQLRKNTTIYKLKTQHKKLWLPGRSQYEALDLIKQECKQYNINITHHEMKSVIIQQLSNNDYDNILLNSFIIIDIYDASANNSVIECISRNIPCFVSNLPAVREYIGDDYPLLFNNINELETMLTNKELIISGYNYLKERPYLKERLTIDNFMKDILNSEITKSLYI